MPLSAGGRLDLAGDRLVEAEFENRDDLARLRELIDADGVLQRIGERLHPAELRSCEIGSR